MAEPITLDEMWKAKHFRDVFHMLARWNVEANDTPEARRIEAQLQSVSPPDPPQPPKFTMPESEPLTRRERKREIEVRDRMNMHAQARRLCPAGPCTRCGFSGKTHVHHADGDWRNNKLKNLVRLCPACHRAAHWELKKQRPSG